MQDIWIALPGLILWTSILFLPWRPWSTRESLDGQTSIELDLSIITALVPARNEEDTIKKSLCSIQNQGNIHKIILIDDQSTDNTIETATAIDADIMVVRGTPLPDNWSGKLWALEQGLVQVETDYILLLDADIELLPGTLSALLKKSREEDIHLVSLMARLRMQSFWEKMLMPAFIYFFKLLYPFSLSNSQNRIIAAAAGGCILIKTDVLRKIGGFDSLKHELIDDCALARKVKAYGGRTWIGLTHSALSHREYNRLSTIWDMVTRTAFTQLRYSFLLLILCSALLIIAFIFPVIAVLGNSLPGQLIGFVTFLIIWGTYIPLIRYYSINVLWIFVLPLSGIIYLIMTWSSAIQHWSGKSAVWKERTYSR